MVLFKKDETNEKIVFIPDKTDFEFIISMIIFIVCNFVLGIGSFIFIDMITKGLNYFS